MTYLAPFALFSSRTAYEEGRIDAHIDDWKRVLTALRDEQLDIKAARNLEKLNGDLEAIVRKP